MSKPDNLSLVQEVVNKQRWWEDLFRTGKIGLLIIPTLAIAKHYIPGAPWPLFEELIFAGAAVLGISVVSAHSTSKKHKEIVTKLNSMRAFASPNKK